MRQRNGRNLRGEAAPKIWKRSEDHIWGLGSFGSITVLCQGSTGRCTTCRLAQTGHMQVNGLCIALCGGGLLERGSSSHSSRRQTHYTSIRFCSLQIDALNGSSLCNEAADIGVDDSALPDITTASPSDDARLGSATQSCGSVISPNSTRRLQHTTSHLFHDYLPSKHRGLVIG